MSNTNETPTNDEGTGRMFSQDEVNRVVQDRLSRQKQTLEQRHAEARQEQTTRIAELENQLADTSNKLADATNRADRSAIDAALKVGANQRGFVDPDDALSLVNRDSIKVEEDGLVVGVEEALDGLAYSKPHLIQRPGKTGSADQGARGGLRQVTREELGSMSLEEYDRRKARGELKHLGVG